MKKVILYIIILFAFIALDSNAQAVPENQRNSIFVADDCGLTTEVPEDDRMVYAGIRKKDSDQIYYIDPKNTTICETDISYRILHMIFGPSIDSTTSESLFYLIHKPDGSNIAEMTARAGVGYTVKSLYQSITILIFMIFTAVIGYQTIKYIHFAQKNGAFMGDEQGQKKSLNVAITSLILIILVTPIGSLMVIQVLVLVLAVIGIKLANYFLSSFLNNTGVQSAEPKLADSMLLMKAESNAETILAGNLCEIQTKQAILTNNYKPDSFYFEKSWYSSFLSLLWFADDNEPLRKANFCVSYYDVIDEQADKIYNISFKMMDFKTCDTNSSTYSPVKREPDQTGHPHECFNASYNWPSETFIDTMVGETGLLTSSADSEQDAVNELERYESAIEEGLYKRKFNFDSNYSVLVESNKDSIIDILNNEYETVTMLREEYIKKLNEIAENYANTLDDEPLLTVNVNNEVTNSQISQLLYIKHLAALNTLNGSYRYNKESNEIPFVNLVNISSLNDINGLYFFAGVAGGIVGNASQIYDNVNNINTHKLYDNVAISGIQNMNKRLMYNAALDLLRSQCVSNISPEDSLGRESFNTYEKIKDNPKDLDTEDSINFDCLILSHVINNENDAKDSPLLKHLIIDDNTSEISEDIADIYENLMSKNPKDAFEAKNDNMDLLTVYNTEKLTNAQNNKVLMASYFYIVNKAMTMKLSKELKKNLDLSVLINTRQKGWASLGGMMLDISTKQINGNALMNDLYNSFQTSAYFTQNEAGEYKFVNTEAFINKKTEEPVSNDMAITPPDLKISYLDNERISVLSNTIRKTSNSSSYQKEAIDRSITEKITAWLIEFLFETPINHIKVGTGLIDSTLDASELEGDGAALQVLLKDCAESGNCYSQHSHPLNAVTMFGQTVLNNTVNILLISSAISWLNKAMEIDSGVSGSVMKSLKAIPGMQIILPILKAALLMIDLFLQFIKPALYTLVLVGLLCGYFLPTIPYLMSTIVILGWYLTIFVITISIPLSLLMWSRIKSDGQTEITFGNVWSLVGTVLVKPPLITIAIILSWVFVNISVYYINSTVYTLFSLSADFGFMFAIIRTILLYVLYMFILYFVIQHSFKIIINFSNEVEELLKISSSNDNNMYSSLGVQNFMASQQMSGIITQMADQSNKNSASLDKIGNQASEFKDSLRERIEAKKKSTDINNS